MKTAASLLPGAKERLSIIDRLLKEIHETPESTLGNKSAALDEAIYIILSFQTDLPRAAAMWSRLRAAYATWDELTSSSEYLSPRSSEKEDCTGKRHE